MSVAWIIFAVCLMLALRYAAKLTEHKAWPIVIAAMAALYLAADSGLLGSGRVEDSTPRREDGDHSVPAPTIYLDGYELGRAKGRPLTVCDVDPAWCDEGGR